MSSQTPTSQNPYQVHVSSNLNPNPLGLQASTPNVGTETINPTLNNKSMAAKQGRPKNLLNLLNDIPKIEDKPGNMVEKMFLEFLNEFKDSENNRVYIDKLKLLPNNNIYTLLIDYDHLNTFNHSLANAIGPYYYRFEKFLLKATLTIALEHIPTYIKQDEFGVNRLDKVKTIDLAWLNFPVECKVRDLKTELIGQLVSVNGTVTRTSEVRPELISASFRCMACNTVVHDIVQQFKYSEPEMCPNSTNFCNNRKEWTLLTHESKFSDWQRVRIQENSDEIPSGSMPRSFDVIVRNDMVEKAKAGDKVKFTGMLIVVPDVSQINAPGVKAASQRGNNSRANDGFGSDGVTGLKALGVRDLTYKLAFLANYVKSELTKKNSIQTLDSELEETQLEFYEQLNEHEKDELARLLNSGRLYERLVKSIAPTVFGHEDIKKGVLLQLLGGVHKTTYEGMKLRGDLNVCIVGDPSTSKSQFLKYICSFIPRSIYTSGKASSAAGLTASVVKDDESGDFTIEAGALMLADNGICAIDEFDKMDIKDQVAIHEAMEQQTISIAKAGVHATLNARTSILAAANPIGGRYNTKLSLKQNIAMTAPIMSRFDLFFVVLDRPDEIKDSLLADHIINSHRFEGISIDPEMDLLDSSQLLRYIRFAKTIKPKLSNEAKSSLAKYYRELRIKDASGVNKNSYRITVRQLESLIRLSEAVARAYGSNDIFNLHVEEAFKLLSKSIDYIDDEDIEYPLQVINNEDDMEQEQAIPISKERFELIKQLIFMRLRADDTNGNKGILKSELIHWYSATILNDLESTNDIEKEAKILKTVINFLIKEKCLIQINYTEDNMDLDFINADNLVTPTDEDPVIFLHPSILGDFNDV